MKAQHAVAVALAAAVLVVFVGTASAFGTVRDLFLGTTAGSKIAFTSFRNGSFDLYVMNADGSKQRRLTTPARSFLPPAWSPDGRRIAFASGPGACILDIHRVHFVSERNVGTTDVDISVANADGSGLRRLTRGPGVDCAPVWSPDGQKIAFQRLLVRGEGDKIVGFDFDVYVINADGSEERNLTGDALSERPIWSPDGRKIAFWSGPDGAGGVYVMNADGSERRAVPAVHRHREVPRDRGAWVRTVFARLPRFRPSRRATLRPRRRSDRPLTCPSVREYLLSAGSVADGEGERDG